MINKSKSSLTRYIASMGLMCSLALPLNAQQIADKNVYEAFKKDNKTASLIIFFHSETKIAQFIKTMNQYKDLSVLALNFMPAVIVTYPSKKSIIDAISSFPSVTHIALNLPAGEKIEVNTSDKKPKIQFRYPGIDKWWANNFKGQSGIVGIIDSGIDINHPAFISKEILVNKTKDSGYFNFHDGIRSPHGTGVACIYSGYPVESDKENIKGVAYKTPFILSTLAGEGAKKKENFWLTYAGLNWFFSANSLKPNIINYSFGNGELTCPTCPDWSGMSMVVDYIVNKHQILWVTSAGNNGYIEPKPQTPFSSTMTIPADNYNALTVANMNMYAEDEKSTTRKYHRSKHAIRYTSSRGPTLLGRKKPDITAPGNDTYTCAPSKKYHFQYTEEMGYEKGYRYMGGTSSAAPHVGGAVLLIREAGITNPMAIKALLINSADSWADSSKPGPDDPYYTYKGGHHPISGSNWNPTYGWGYMNMNNAFEQRNHLLVNHLSLEKPVVHYTVTMKPQGKITLVHERRVGFNPDGRPWKLSPLKLELIDASTNKVLAYDESALDTVHQVSICTKNKDICKNNKLAQLIVRISLVGKTLEGANIEPFALAYT